jgi:hypothetical protein
MTARYAWGWDDHRRMAVANLVRPTLLQRLAPHEVDAQAAAERILVRLGLVKARRPSPHWVRPR